MQQEVDLSQFGQGRRDRGRPLRERGSGLNRLLEALFGGLIISEVVILDHGDFGPDPRVAVIDLQRLHVMVFGEFRVPQLLVDLPGVRVRVAPHRSVLAQGRLLDEVLAEDRQVNCQSLLKLLPLLQHERLLELLLDLFVAQLLRDGRLDALDIRLRRRILAGLDLLLWVVESK